MRSLLATAGTVTAVVLLAGSLLVGAVVLEPTSGSTTSTEDALATSEADRLVSEHSPVAVRSHVLGTEALTELTADDLEVTCDTTAVAVHVNDTQLVETGATDNGTTVERVVLLRETEPQTKQNETVVVPAGAVNVTVTGFDGRLVVDDRPLTAQREPPVPVVVSQSRETPITAADNVTVTYDEPRYEPAVLTVTVVREDH